MRVSAIVVVCAVIGINLLARFVQSSTGGGATPGGKRSSAYATKDDGVAAYAELLGKASYAVVRTRGPLSNARLDPSSTVVILDPETISRDDGNVLLTFLVNGGRLVIGGTFPSYFSTLSDNPPAWGPSGPTLWKHAASSLARSRESSATATDISPIPAAASRSSPTGAATRS